ncbi:MAG: antitoxin [Actinomycetota bacterium]
MRTTIDLPDDLHRIASSIARDRKVSLSETVADLLRNAIGSTGSAQVALSERTGLKMIRLGRTITSDDVRELDDGP